ncbi:MAG: N-acetylmuramoyl-L-alanine amidase [Patescibacteria group bacterium]
MLLDESFADKIHLPLKNMKYVAWSIVAVWFVLITSIIGVIVFPNQEMSGAPPYGEDLTEIPPFDPRVLGAQWERPNVPTRVGIQVGHWKNDEVPDELENLRGNTGAQGGGKSEWEVNYSIAVEMAAMLESQGVMVDILPATVPPEYWADVFVAIHADGSLDQSVSGFKFAGPWRDVTGKSAKLVQLLEQEYLLQTQLPLDPNVTRNMRGYYAFSWWRFEHSIHPMTVAVIAETGFLTNPSDQRFLIDSPEISARAMADGVLAFLEGEGLLESG